MILDPIKPYLPLIKVGAIVLLVLGGVITGCRHGEKNKQGKIDTLTTQVEELSSANKAWADTAKEVKEQKEAADKLAAERDARNKKVEEEIAKLRLQKAKADATFEEQLKKAKEDPTCAQLLKQQLCPLVSLPSR